jgi:prevent-host-death family protein
MTTLSATDARNRFFELLNLAMYRGEEFLVEKDGRPAVRLVPADGKKSSERVKTVLAEFRKTFAKSAKRKYWSVLDTPAWKKNERKYLENISKGILRGQHSS